MSDIHTEHTLAETLARLERLMRVKQLQVNALLEISQAINNNISTPALLRIYEFILRAQLNVRKLLVFVKNDNWECVCASGVSDSGKKINVEEDLARFKKLTELDKHTKSGINKEFDVVIPVYHKENPLAYVLLAEVKSDYNDTYEEQLKFIQTITNIVIVAVENRKLLSSQIEQQVMKKELEFAAKMQSMLFPEQLPGDSTVEMAAVYLPHHDIGGDYYDYIQLSENEMAFCVGDISGKGVAAALLMANFQATLRMLIRNYGNIEQFIEEINDNVSRITRGDKFITLFLGIYNSKTRVLKYVNAGHNPSLLFQDGKITELEKGCTLLGMFENLPSIKGGEVKLKKNAVLLNYTDGLTDFENERGEYYGLERLVAFFKKEHKLPMDEFNEKLISEVREYKGEKGIFLDDITLLSCRFF